MKKILFFAFLLCSFSAFAQYPATPTTKQELGRQTTGDGLIYRGSGAPAYTPANNRNAWIYYDTTNNRLYKSRLGSWSLMIQDTSAFNEIQMPYIVDDTLYLTQNVTGEPLTAYVNRVWPITNLSDTTSITGENQGDVAIVASGDTVAFRGSAYWSPFSGGGGGGSFTSFNIAGDSGTPQTITDGNTATFEGGFGITTSTLLTDQLRVEIDSSQVLTASAFLTAYLALSADINTRVQGSGTANKYTRFLSTGSPASIGDGNMTHSATGPVVDANLAHRITGGTTAIRPTGAAGMMYWNTSNVWWDYHNGTAWFNPARSSTVTGLGTSTHNAYYNGSGLLEGSANWTFDPNNRRILLTGTAAGGTNGASFQITGSGSAGLVAAFRASLLAGYTGNGSNFGVYAQNQTAGTAADEFSNAQAANYGEYIATTTGTIIGQAGYASGGNRSYGGLFRAIIAKNNAANIGAAGYAINTGTSPIQIGGIFALRNDLPTMESAALIADNGTQTSPIFLARDNNTTVFSIVNGGAVATTSTVQVGSYTGTANGIAGKTSAGILTTIPEGYGINLTAGGSLEADTTQMTTQSDLAAVAASVAAIPTPRYGKFTGTTDVNGALTITLSGTPATGACTCTNNGSTSGSWRLLFSARHTGGTSVEIRVWDTDTFSMAASTAIDFSVICY